MSDKLRATGFEGSTGVSSAPTVDCHAGPIPLVSRLGDLLVRREVPCCQWKGTFSLDAMISGEKDIDLLVESSRMADVEACLHELGFKQAFKPSDDPALGMSHYFGFDDATDRIVHLHLHERIVVGNRMRGHSFLPVERPYLAAAIDQKPFPLPDPNFEYILFVIRMLLDQVTWRPGKTIGLPRRRARELDFLEKRICLSEVEDILATHLPWWSGPSFHACRLALRSGDRSLAKKGRVLLRQLEELGWHHTDHFALRLCRRVSRALRERVLRQQPSKRRMRPPGTMIAVVGGDGSGKSTTTQALHRELSEHFDVRVVHFGKPPRSAFTWVGRCFLKLGRALNRLFGAALPAMKWSTMAWRFCTARDRYSIYKQMLRWREEGRIVIADRWPLPKLLSMDGPQIRNLDARKSGWLTQAVAGALATREEKWLGLIERPDLLLVLRVDPAIAVQRRPDEDAAFVRSRAKEIGDTDWNHAAGHVIDAAKPVDAVTSEAKKLVWPAL